MNLDVTRVTNEQLLEQFKNRIVADPQFKGLTAASIYQLYMEMMTGVFDMLNFYLGRTAEELFFDSAKLDSSFIKLSKNLGYNPKRAIPATAEIAIKLSGPLPEIAAVGDVIWFNNEQLRLRFNDRDYRLDHCYSYTLTETDIANGKSDPNWSKTIRYSIPHSADANGWVPLSSNADMLDKIKIIQCNIKTQEIYAVEHAENIGKSYQFYDIDDISFSNYYSKRDPFAYSENVYTPTAGWCKIGIGLNKTDAFSEQKLCDIEVENIYCNSKVKAANNDLSVTKKLNVCRVESNQDKTVRITFGDGTLVNNGFNNENEILYVQYVTTDGYIANTPDVIGSVVTAANPVMAHSPGKVYDISANVSFILTTNITGGADFESQLSMKNNAIVYFASRGQLVNAKDFIAYFNALSTPMSVKNAIAWSAVDLIAKSTKFTQPDVAYNKFVENCAACKDYVFYSLVGELYNSSSNQYTVNNVYDTSNDAGVNASTLYTTATTFANHIQDLAKTINHSDELIQTQIISKSDPYYVKTNEIYNDIDEKLTFGVIPISITPIVHYYDVVGTVELDRLANVSQYQTSVEGAIYKWLSDTQKFNNKIYKSDIVKKIYENALTKSVNIDIKPSGLIRSNVRTYTFAMSENNAATDNAREAYITSINTYKNNLIILPQVAQSASNTNCVMSKAFLLAKHNIGFTVEQNGQPVTVSIKNVTELDDGRFAVELANTYDFGDLTTATELYMTVSTEDSSFESAANSTSNAPNAILTNMLSCMSTATSAKGTTQTAIALPYAADVTNDSNTQYERYLGYVRASNSTFSVSGCNEKSFNMYFAPLADNIDDTYYQAYQYAKFAIEDSVLDDNNNIVNYTLPNEISVLRLQLTYTYGR